MTKRSWITISLVLTLILFLMAAYNAFDAMMLLEELESSAEAGSTGPESAVLSLVASLGLIIFGAAAVALLVLLIIKLITRAVEHNFMVFISLLLDIAVAVMLVIIVDLPTIDFANLTSDNILSLGLCGACALTAGVDAIALFTP